MFNNKQAYHGFNRIIIYLTYPGWCCSQNCDKCESFGDMVKSVELVVHWFPYGISASSKRFIVRTHQKWSKSRPIMEISKNNKDKSSKCFKKVTLQPEFPPGMKQKIGSFSWVFGVPHHHHQSGRIGRIGWSHDRTGRAETKTCCFFGNTILVISRGWNNKSNK